MKNTKTCGGKMKKLISEHKFNRVAQHPDAINVLAYYLKEVDGPVVRAPWIAIDAFKLNNFLYVFIDNARGMTYYARYDVSEGVVRHDFIGWCPLQLRNPF